MKTYFSKYTILFCLILAPVLAHAADLPGSMDKSFGANGKVVTDGVATEYPDHNLGSAGALSKVATQSDRKVVVFGYQNKLLRFNADGRADSGFGVNGVVNTGNFIFNYTGDVAIQSDGKIVVAGRDGDGSTFRLERYNSNGTLDTSFGTNGVVKTSISAYNNGYARSLHIQSDGKLVVGGEAVISSYCFYDGWSTACYFYDSGVLVRYNPDGSLDSSFGTNGIVIAAKSSPDTYSAINDIAIDSSGNIIATGLNPTLSQYDSNGNPITTFGTNGQVYASYTGGEVELYGDGNILISADGHGLARYLSSGAIDDSFGVGGVVSVSQPETIASIALVGDEIIVGGEYKTYRQTNKQYWTFAGGYYVYLTEITKVYSISRYRGNGWLDTSFGTQGTTTISFNDNDTLSDLAIDAYGKIVAVGATDRDPLTDPMLDSNYRYENQFALARINR